MARYHCVLDLLTYIRGDLGTIGARWERTLGGRPALLSQLPGLLDGEPPAQVDDPVTELAALRDAVIGHLGEIAPDARLADVIGATAPLDRALAAAIRRQAAHRAALRERLSGLLGHDLANPFHAILMSCGVLLADPQVSPKQANLAERIQRGAERARRMTTDVLDFVRGQLGAPPPVLRRRADMAAICAAAVAEVADSHPGRAVATVLDGDLAGRWDADRIAHALAHLIGNAFVHGADPVTLRAIGDGDAVVTTVEDGGGPIEPGRLATLFDPFRPPGDPRRRRGLGLGLHVVEQIARAHGATLAVTSTGGTRVAIRWPR
jgi:signal transduction histidine kinase